MCGCNSFQDSESFLKQFFSSSCFLSLTTSALDSILFFRIRGGTDIIYKINLEVTEEAFACISNDIATKTYHGAKNVQIIPSKTDASNELVQAFFAKVYPFIDINNSVNCILFKLLMCAFTLKTSISTSQNITYFFQILRCVNLSNKDADMTIKTIPYPQFCESMLYYLSVVLSGFTKIVFETLDENNSDEIVRMDLDKHLKEIFSRDMVSQYYSEKIIPHFMKAIENLKHFTTLEAYFVTSDDMELICKHNPQLINYLQLREHYIEFAYENYNKLAKK